MHLDIQYLGLQLKNPLIVGASPLADDLDKVRRLEDAGAAAITMYSLFEEQITQNLIGSETHIGTYENSFLEAASYFPEVTLLERDVDTYLEHMQRVKSTVDVPVIASLNGTREGEWLLYARCMEQSGADALELNLYFLATDLQESAANLEDRCLRIIQAIRTHISIPLAVKLSPSYTALPHFAKRLSAAKVDGLVLFNRFYQPDFDIEELNVQPTLDLSSSNELRLRLRWLALLSERVSCDLSVSGGVHTGIDAVKAIMAGAHSVQMVSTLLINGPDRLADILNEMKTWMMEHEYASIDQMRGCMNYGHCPDPEALERANYMRVLKSWHPQQHLH